MDRHELDLMLDAADRWFADHAPLADRVARFRDGHHAAAGAWERFAELGWLALTLPEDAGGFGAGARAAFELIRRAGRDARPEPLELHLLLAPLVAAAQPELADPLATGRMQLALADVPNRGALLRLHGAPGEGDAGSNAPAAPGRVQHPSGGLSISGQVAAVYGAEHATHVLVPLRSAPEAPLLLVPMPAGAGWSRPTGNAGPGASADPARGPDRPAGAVSATPARLLDGRPGLQLGFDHTPAQSLGAFAGQALDRAAAALVADAAGSFEAAYAMTLDYLKQRQQFGRPLSSQQVLQHRMAEVFCDLQQHLALVDRLAAEIEAEPAGPWPTLPVAKSFVGRRALRGVGQLIQVSGGIAVTEEYRLTHLYRRLHVAAALFGGAEAQLERIDVRATLQPA